MGHAETEDPGRARLEDDLDGRVLDAVHAEPRLQGRSEDGRARGGHVPVERARRPADRRVVGPVLRERRPLPQGDRAGGRRAARRARLHRAVYSRPSEAVRAREPRRGADAGRPQPHLLHQLGLGVGRHRDEGRARLLAGEGPGRSHDVHLPRARVSRRQLRRRLARRHGEQPPALRPDAARASRTCGTRTSRRTSSSRAKAATASSSPRTWCG